MKSYFDGLAGMGRYPDKTRGEIFARHRQYFDQILYKNMRFRHEYAQAYALWKQEKLGLEPEELICQRIIAGIHYTGEEAVTKLFAQILAALGHITPLLPPNLDYHRTLPKGDIDTNRAYSEHMRSLRRFWLRLALPDINEETFSPAE
ncbi:MAG: hypothetical protein PHN64_06095 [Desulfovibrionaceae bacterium]|nr:hypothetical protein [Desulfovibrionaceae bacterium]